MKKMFFGFVAMFVAVLFLQSAFAASLFPGSDSIGEDIGENLLGFPDRPYEPSGVLWHERLQSLIVVWDEGYITEIDVDGNLRHANTLIGGDLEGITVVDPQSNYIYLLEENTPKIIEVDISSWTKTGKVWTLKDNFGNSLPKDTRRGAEALSYDREKGLFYVGSQYNGEIYLYNIDLSTSATVNSSGLIENAINDLSGLTYLPETKTTYAVFDGPNILKEYHEDGSVIEYVLPPGTEQEGIALLPDCSSNTATLFIAEDTPSKLKKYSGYPIDCVEEIPAWSQIYDYQTLIPYTTTELRENYHVFDKKGEFSYFSIPAQEIGAWYLFELDGRSTTLDGLHSLGINVRSVEGRYTETRNVTSTEWQTYSFYHYIPANTATQIRLTSNVNGFDLNGVKREHHLRTVTVTRVQEELDTSRLPVITNFTTQVAKTRAVLSVSSDIEASFRIVINGSTSVDTDLVTSKTWTFKNLACGTVYDYQVQLYPDLYSFSLNNFVNQSGSFTTAACI